MSEQKGTPPPNPRSTAPTSGAESEPAKGDTLPAQPPSDVERELVDASATATAQPPRIVVPRWVQLVLLPISLLALWVLARAAGKVLLIFVVAAVIALIL
ncbi:MAG TPA: hypothetical protein VIJ33_03825, partial [Solirubrobacteraceae bacterium]